jgi:uncharacterized protein with NAD-binding domain and iron-sulfur cluster
MNDDTTEILKKIQDKKTLDAISREMNIRKTTLKARVHSLIQQGLLAEITYASGCGMCPMNCRSDSCQAPLILFSVTEKGKRLINS